MAEAAHGLAALRADDDATAGGHHRRPDRLDQRPRCRDDRGAGRAARGLGRPAGDASPEPVLEARPMRILHRRRSRALPRRRRLARSGRGATRSSASRQRDEAVAVGGRGSSPTSSSWTSGCPVGPGSTATARIKAARPGDRDRHADRQRGRGRPVRGDQGRRPGATCSRTSRRRSCDRCSRRSLAARPAITPATAARIIDEFVAATLAASAQAGRRPADPDRLTERELDVLALVTARSAQQGDRGRARDQREHGQVPPQEHRREAPRREPCRAGGARRPRGPAYRATGRPSDLTSGGPRSGRGPSGTALPYPAR